MAPEVDSGVCHGTHEARRPLPQPAGFGQDHSLGGLAPCCRHRTGRDQPLQLLNHF
jgi:hypothetical protein